MLSAIAAIAENEERIKVMFVSHTINKEGLFGVWTYINGEKKQVLLDSYFPCKNQKPVFSRAKGKELWVMLIEKAWAKIHGTYERIITGQSYEALRDFMGAPAYYLKVNQENALEVIREAYQNKYIMTATSEPNPEQKKKLMTKGILTLQSYSLIRIEKVPDHHGNQVTLI